MGLGGDAVLAVKMESFLHFIQTFYLGLFHAILDSFK